MPQIRISLSLQLVESRKKEFMSPLQTTSVSTMVHAIIKMIANIFFNDYHIFTNNVVTFEENMVSHVENEVIFEGKNDIR